MPIPKDILAYNAEQTPEDRRICDALAEIIDAHFSGAKSGTKPGAKSGPMAPEGVECKVWHRHPVWFLGGNPIVGCSKIKDAVRLMFWSGQSFDEPGLTPEPPGTKFKSAGVRFTSAGEISAKNLKRWLRNSVEIQWDYKNIVKRKGRLVRLK